MKVYIASKYIEHRKINRMIYSKLNNICIDAFLPETINIDAINKEEMFFVANTCYNEIDKCDIIIIVAPFGKSVAAEVGFAIFQKRNTNKKTLILYNYNDNNINKTKKESMIYPYIDKEFDNIDDLVNYLLVLKKKDCWGCVFELEKYYSIFFRQ